MGLKVKLLAGVAVVAGATAAVPASAQTGGQIETVVVTGVRASLESAIATKQNAGEIVDSIVAQDIGKLPDTTVADALQRISGVQIAHDFGEGGNMQNPAFQGVTIHGLNQVEYNLNGQEVVTAAGIRFYDVEDMPSELVKAVNVYKTPSADLMEGGIGGLINIQTLKPFDFDGPEVAADAHLDYSLLPDALRPAGSILLSDRWNTSIGEIGALVDVSYQDRRIREDWAGEGNPIPNTVAVPGSSILTPNGTYIPWYVANRPRIGLSAALQWRPTDSLEFYAQANDNRLGTFQNQYTYDGYPAVALSIPGTFTLFPGTKYASKGSFGPMPTSGAYSGFGTIQGARDSTEYNQDYTIGGTWNASDDFTLSGSLDWQHSTYLLNVAYGYLEVPNETWNFDESGDVSGSTFTGPDLTNFSNYIIKGSSVSYTQQWYNTYNTAGKMDAQWRQKLGPIDEFDFGIRYSDHEAVYNQTNGYSVTDPDNNPQNNADLYELVDTHNFEGAVNQLTKFWIFKPDILRNNYGNESAIYGGTTLPSFNPHYVFTMSERNLEGYLEAKIDLGSLDGNFGVRVVNTNRASAGTLTSVVSGVNVYSPVTYHTNRTDILPSVNLRFHFTDELQMRFAASRTMTRPDFSSMNPNTTYNTGSVAANVGNIHLPPMYSSNYDLALEYYFGKGDVLYIDGFTKSVHNFPYSDTFQQMYDDGLGYGPRLYTFTEKEASTVGGSIKGFEAGYTQFFDFLPGLWKGLGMQANYTYVDSTQPYYLSASNVLKTTLPYLSRHTFTLIGMYELDPVSLRVAYTWRSSFLQAIYTGTGTGNVPQTEAAYGWLDASFNYKITDQITGYVQGVNLLDTLQRTYEGVPYAELSQWATGREIILGVRYKM